MASFLDELAQERGWVGRDEGILKPLKRAPYQPECSCPPELQKPQADLSARTVRCGHCRQEIGKSCKRRAVGHIRMLLDLPEGCADWADAADAGLVFE